MKNKNSKKLVIGIGGSLGVLIIGIVCFLVGGYLAGWDIVGFLTSGKAMLIYGILAIVVILLIGLIVYVKVMKK